MSMTADLLTGARGLIAFGMILALSNRYVATAAVLLALAWITDFLDGRAARAGSGDTLLGGWDLEVDTLVGAAVLIGLDRGDLIPGWLAWGLLLLLGIPFLVLRHPTPAMILQAVAYASVLFHAWSTPVRWVLPAAILLVLVADFERFRTVTLPSFFSGFLVLLPDRDGEDR